MKPLTNHETPFTYLVCGRGTEGDFFYVRCLNVSGENPDITFSSNPSSKNYRAGCEHLVVGKNLEINYTNIMKNNNKNGLRLYFFVMYNLSGIQKGIQAGHAALEYANVHGHTDQYKDFIENHKTFILLDGGGSQELANDRVDELEKFGCLFESFQEPDLNGSMSAIAFIVPETIYNYDYSEVDYHSYIETEATIPREMAIYRWLKGFRLASN